MPDRNGGEVIEMLNKPMAKFAAQYTHISAQSPIFQPDKNKLKNRLASAENSPAALPELLSSTEKEMKDKRDTVIRGPSTLSHDAAVIPLKRSLDEKSDLASFANKEARN